MRDTTERPEGIEAGTLKLVGTDEEIIYRTFTELLEKRKSIKNGSCAEPVWGWLCISPYCKYFAGIAIELRDRKNGIEMTEIPG